MAKLEQEVKKRSFKILAYSDVHGDVMTISRLVELAKKEDVDLVVNCGDFTKCGANWQNMIGPFLDIGKKLVFIPGNHEDESTADFLAGMYHVKNIHGYGVRYGKVGLFGCGGGDVGVNRISDAEAHVKLREGFEKIKYLKHRVMVLHNHPAGTMMEKFSAIVSGNKGVRKAIEEMKPDVVICGHVHEASGIEEMIGASRIVNVAKTGKVIEILLDEDNVMPSGSE